MANVSAFLKRMHVLLTPSFVTTAKSSRKPLKIISTASAEPPMMNHSAFLCHLTRTICIRSLFSRFYIGCDTCQDWFHGTCVNVTKAQADRMDTYICPRCKRSSSSEKAQSSSSSSSNSASSALYSRLVLEDHHWEHLRRLIRALQVLRTPVD